MSYNAPPKKKPSWFVALIGAAIGFFAVRTYVFPQKSTEEKLREASIAVNKKLPMMSPDGITRCDLTYTGPGNVLNYNMTVMGVRAGELENKEELKKDAESHLAQNYRSQSEMKALREIGTVLSYHCFDEAGALIFDVEVDPKKF